MAEYTVQNMKEVEDQAPKFGHSPHLEARMARVPLELEEFGISYQRIAPGFRVPFAHRRRSTSSSPAACGSSSATTSSS